MNRPNLVYAAFETPCLDRLAREGALFTDAHATSALCTPSRYGILTGRYNWRSRLKRGVLGGYSSHLIETDRKTVAHFLRENGYATGCVGKWHLGMDWTMRDGATEEERTDFLFDGNRVDFSAPVKNGPTACGFDSFFGISSSLDMPPYVYLKNNHPTALPDHEFEGSEAPAFARPSYPHSAFPGISGKIRRQCVRGFLPDVRRCGRADSGAPEKGRAGREHHPDLHLRQRLCPYCQHSRAYRPRPQSQRVVPRP